MKRILAAATVLVAGAVAVVPSAIARGGGAAGVDLSKVKPVAVSKTGVYVVVLDQLPAIGYEGGLAGLRATKPADGDKIDRRSADVRKYVGFLEGEQNKALSAAGVPRSSVLAKYRYAGAGFAAKLTAKQASALAAQPGVALVQPDVVRHVTDDSKAAKPSPTSAAFLDLTRKKGVYASGVNGEGVVVGVLDTGIWPEHPSLDPTGFGPAPASFTGTGCDFGNSAFNANDVPFTCNNKLLAAKKYAAALTAADLVPGSYWSARDDDGHGTHTATTAAGNSGVRASILGNDFGPVTGIAPRARVSAYKVCWNGNAGGCAGADTAQAIDDAVADGVDVINFSIGGNTPAFTLDDLNFLFANDAGVFVSRSAGNEGPAPQTIGTSSVAPWVTVVGASTTDATFEAAVTLGDGRVFRGASVTSGVGSAPLVDAASVGNPRCLEDVAFTAPVTGKIVLCVRGTNARVAKSKAVKAAGGAGMVLYNGVAPQGTVTDNHHVPSVHLDNAAGLEVKAYIATAGSAATASISAAAKAPAQGSVMADFSSRGPNGFAADVIVPDVTAPGVNILAGETPTATAAASGQLFQAISGTSMSAPHVAGIYALLKQVHPDWSAAAAKSALMTTARQDVTKEDGVTPADPFDMGAGHVRPGGEFGRKNTLFNPGIVYDADVFDYLGFTCESFPVLPRLLLQSPTACDTLAGAGVPTTAENLNLASIGVSDVTGFATLTRTVTNVSGRKLELESKVVAPAGFKVKVSPKELKLRAGESKSFTVTFTRTTAAFGEWSFGSLTWKGEDYKARSPLAAKAQEFSAPDLVPGSGDSGSIAIPVKFGYAGSFAASASGLVASTSIAGTVVDDPNNNLDTAIANGDYSLEQVTIPAGTKAVRFGLRDADTEAGADLDLYVFDSAFNQVGASGSGTAHETVDLIDPADTTYFVLIHGFEAPGGDSPYVLRTWAVPATGGGSLSVTSAPSAAVLGGSGTVNVAWTGAGTSPEQLGAVTHTGTSGQLAVTLVEVNTIG